MGPLDGALRLTLLALLLQPVGDWRVRTLVTALAGLGLLLPRVLGTPWLWASLTTLAGARIALDWPMADNHAYLLCWWTLAIALAVSSAEPAAVLATSARLLVGLVFAFATLWKAVLTRDFLDIRFARVQLVTDRTRSSSSSRSGPTWPWPRSRDSAGFSWRSVQARRTGAGPGRGGRTRSSS